MLVLLMNNFDFSRRVACELNKKVLNYKRDTTITSRIIKLPPNLKALMVFFSLTKYRLLREIALISMLINMFVQTKQMVAVNE